MPKIILEHRFFFKCIQTNRVKQADFINLHQSSQELASTFKSSKDDKKEDRRDRDRDRNRDVEKDYSKPVSLPVQKAGLLSQCLLVS